MPAISYKWSVSPDNEKILVDIYSGNVLIPVKSFALPVAVFNTREVIEAECTRIARSVRDTIDMENNQRRDRPLTSVDALRSNAPSRPITID